MKTIKKYITNDYQAHHSISDALRSSNSQKRYFPVRLILILTAIIAVSLPSCKKFVQIPPPETLLTTPSVFNSNSSATSALTYIYTKMDGSISYPVALYGGLAADELMNYSTNSQQQQVYKNAQLAATNATTSFIWQSHYTYIYQANAIIEGLQKYTGVSQAVKQQLTGEAKFLRALFHFNLTSFYGDIPLDLTTDYTVTDRLSRTPRIQVLQQVIADLQDAQGKLNVNYVDLSDTLTTTERVRPNRAVATALLARAYLYLGNYTNDATYYINAENQATAVINNSTYSLSPLTGANSVFNKNSTETIWSLQTSLPTSNYSTTEGRSFILIAGPTNIALSTQLLSSFEPNDQRKVNWVGSFTTTKVPIITSFFPYKYKDRNGTTGSLEYAIVLRLAEQYLIRAEARAQQGNASGALSDLNTIRTRAGLPNYSGLTDKTSLLTAILHERQVELFTEWGHRWFDLNRTGNVNTVMGSPGNVCQAKGGAWSSNWQVFPIPFNDINFNPNLTQNPGY